MKFGFYTPNFGFCGDARTLAELAHEAEESGWDGFFVWDHLQFEEPTADPWVALAAMALRTARIRLGTLVTPLPRRHVAKLAREVVTLDHLSGGRVTLGVGAGYPTLPDYAAFGDGGDPRVRAAQLDEGLELLAALWSGNPVKHHGTYYHAECDAFQPALQRPRVPVWVAATWPSQKPLRRAARWDGVALTAKVGLEVAPEALRSAVSAIAACRASKRPFDVVAFGKTRDPRDAKTVEACAEAGASWWLESIFTWETSLAATRERLHQGPPSI